MSRWVLGAPAALVVAGAACATRSLSNSGAVAAVVCGSLAVAAGWDWGIVLIAYFVTSSLLSRFRHEAKQRLTAGRLDKGGARDAAQVLANGGVFALASAGYVLTGTALWQAVGAAALAASAADTWATEIGSLARATPVSVLDWTPVQIGTSGGVTAQGFAAAFAGAAFVSVVCSLLRWSPIAVTAAMVGGVAGCLVDSMLGASVQARRWCAACAMATEQRIHRCGAPTTITGGWRWLDNDGVNALSSLGGAFIGVTVASFV